MTVSRKPIEFGTKYSHKICKIETLHESNVQNIIRNEKMNQYFAVGNLLVW